VVSHSEPVTSSRAESRARKEKGDTGKASQEKESQGNSPAAAAAVAAALPSCIQRLSTREIKDICTKRLAAHVPLSDQLRRLDLGGYLPLEEDLLEIRMTCEKRKH
jgi:hypothetical protein